MLFLFVACAGRQSGTPEEQPSFAGAGGQDEASNAADGGPANPGGAAGVQSDVGGRGGGITASGGAVAATGGAGASAPPPGGASGGGGACPPHSSRGHLGKYRDKFMWLGSGETFTPAFVMLGDNDGTDLSKITQSSLDAFLTEMFDGHGFNGVHVVVLGQWFHIGNYTVSASDRTPDTRTFAALKMILQAVHAKGGATHLWLWGDEQRGQTSRSLAGGAMGPEEKALLDKIYSELNEIPGWSMGYGFDLHEWVDADLLKRWHDYMHAKPKFMHLLGARAQKLEVNQIYGGLDYSSYENHKPDYALFRRLMQHQPEKPSFSEDRFRVRGRDKDLTAEETRVTLWLASLAGGVAGIYGYLGSETGTSRAYPNKAALRTYAEFWRGRFFKDMVPDNTLVTGGFALKQSDTHAIYFAQATKQVQYSVVGAAKQVIAVDATTPYQEIDLGVKEPGAYIFDAPRMSDWALAAGRFCR
ncbi:MAG: hypothetical protein SF187_21375 [Deltaproteobacteria bacterium]|nr:hypothetical protein [Deltaproteobacteria bacterium]